MRKFGFVAFAWMALFCAARPATAQDHALRVAIANPYRIYSAMKETADFQEKMKTDAQQLVSQDQQKQAAIQQLAEERRTQVKPDHPHYVELSRKIDQMTADYNSWKAVVKSDQERTQKIKFIATYKKIEDAVGRVAEREKIDIVLSTGPRELPGNVEGMTFTELDALIASRKIMYAKNTPDITEQAIALLDADYARAQKQP